MWLSERPSNNDNIHQQSWQVFIGAVLHWVQSKCCVINLVSAVTLGPNGVNSHLACRAAGPFSGLCFLASCSSVLQPFFCQFLWLIHHLFCNALHVQCIFNLWCWDFSDVCCLLSLQIPGSVTRHRGNTLFLEHLCDLFSIFPFQNLLSRIPPCLSQTVISLDWTGDQEINQILWGFCAE